MPGKTALCVGIDRYSRQPLDGSVKDAKRWRRILRNEGFQCTLVSDADATRSTILSQLRKHVDEAERGDIVVFMFAGHGLQVTDHNRDEKDNRDEALVPYDFDPAGYITDDDLAKVTARAADGVNVTFFIDACHSATISRSFLGGFDRYVDQETNVRQFHPSAYHDRIHTESRDGGRKRSTRGNAHEILFAACQDDQEAKESIRAQSGRFTMAAMQVLQDGVADLTNREFIEQVIDIFEDQHWINNQRPNLLCRIADENAPLLGSRTGSSTANRREPERDKPDSDRNRPKQNRRKKPKKGRESIAASMRNRFRNRGLREEEIDLEAVLVAVAENMKKTRKELKKIRKSL